MARRKGLSIDEYEWRQLTVALSGTKWHSTWLDHFFRRTVPQYPGIYILHTFPQTMSDIFSLPSEVSGVLYVGRSNNLRDRFTSHSSAHNPNERIRQFSSIFGRLRFSYTHPPSASVMAADNWMRDAEHTLVAVLDPPANRVVPTASSVLGKIGQSVAV